MSAPNVALSGGRALAVDLARRSRPSAGEKS